VGFVARRSSYCYVANRFSATNFHHYSQPSKLTHNFEEEGPGANSNGRRASKMEPTLLPAFAIMSPRRAAHFAL